uniref:Photosystem I reaction center subunit XI, chloroplastic n=1 Tax=Chloropicon laureae TaxID=464258 RepID=A0A7S2Z835_9CHLO|mmetsp:Transcript_16883/g.34570  ORF Transcript_16883/g.34570 Transcript_16883/m.34570 type:complete len:209 (+) Transcript_16883:131-757(+)|eukprot:CAMPEP_0197492716 /NCGR_PEP_ID=MMETSP1311-20131121/13828_1 /TAXON_ID=464262 /ORGANISM="Genus nov. species nov., Strain RCC856" /LENGTH=208 /DNA_ID=CAMNT_0043037783 /DNA_START=93 /DNA_END=719 /DNA_ORIENTATION=-
MNMNLSRQVRGLGASSGLASRRVARVAGAGARVTSKTFTTRLNAAEKPNAVVKPINGDPFIGMMETPVTSAPIVANFLSNLPAYRTGVAPVLRGVEIGLTHGFFVTGPFIKLGPLRDAAGNTPEVSGCLSGAGLVLILTLGLTIYGVASFQSEDPDALGVKTLTGRSVSKDPLQTKAGWEEFTSGFLVGGLSGVLYAYICTQLLPLYS